MAQGNCHSSQVLFTLSHLGQSQQQGRQGIFHWISSHPGIQEDMKVDEAVKWVTGTALPNLQLRKHYKNRESGYTKQPPWMLWMLISLWDGIRRPTFNVSSFSRKATHYDSHIKAHDSWMCTGLQNYQEPTSEPLHRSNHCQFGELSNLYLLARLVFQIQDMLLPYLFQVMQDHYGNS